MPLTPIQKDALAAPAANRSEESHFAGGLVLHAADDSARFSHDFDIFHELAEEVARASNRDVASLRAAGFQVDTPSATGNGRRTPPSARPGSRAARRLWRSTGPRIPPSVSSRSSATHCSAGGCTGSISPPTRRSRCRPAETRDYVDIVELHRTYPLAAICWAACGKDPGFSPLSLLKMMRRFARLDPAKLEEIQARALDPRALKTAWIAMSDEAEAKMVQLADGQPDLPIGVAFVDTRGNPGWIGDDPSLSLHAPSVRGCWPRLHGVEP